MHITDDIYTKPAKAAESYIYHMGFVTGAGDHLAEERDQHHTRRAADLVSGSIDTKAVARSSLRCSSRTWSTNFKLDFVKSEYDSRETTKFYVSTARPTNISRQLTFFFFFFFFFFSFQNSFHRQRLLPWHYPVCLRLVHGPCAMSWTKTQHSGGPCFGRSSIMSLLKRRRSSPDLHETIAKRRCRLIKLCTNA